MSHPKTTAEQKRAMPWLMLHAEYLDNYEFGSCSWQAQGIYWKFYLYAWSQDGTGEIHAKSGLIEHDLGKIAYRLHTNPAELQNAFDELAAAGFLEKHGKYYRLARYAEEQVNQAEQRQGARERQAKRRESHKNSNNESDSDKDSYRESVTYPSLTRESHVTFDGQTDGNDKSFSHSERFVAMQRQAEVPEEKPPSKPKPNEPYNGSYDFDSDILELTTYCKRVGGIEPTNALAAKFDDLLQYEHVTKPRIKEIIDRLATREDVNNPVAYLFKSLKELEPQPCTQSAAEYAVSRLLAEWRENGSEPGSEPTIDDLDSELVEMGYEKPEHSDYVKWEIIKRPAESEPAGSEL